MKKSLVLLVLIAIGSGSAFGQKGDVNVIKDPRLNALVAKQSEVIPPDVNPKVDGYRIQLFFDSERGTINDARSRFIAQFPRVDTYVEFNAPNYYLKAGDFRTRLEAERVKAAIEAQFPGCFIILEKINLPRIYKDEQSQ